MDVDLVSLVHSEEEERQADEMRRDNITVTTCRPSILHRATRCASALWTGAPLTHALLDAPNLTATIEAVIAARRPDVVLAYCSGMARYALQRPLMGVPFVLDMVDVDSEKWNELGRTGAPPRKWIYAREGRLLASFEALAVQSAAATLVVNERERRAVLALAPDVRVEIVRNGIDLGAMTPPDVPAPSSDVVFCGVMNYPPNQEGALWMIEHVWPKVRSRRSDARLMLVGADPPGSLREAARSDASIIITGTVADVRPYLWGAAVSAAPLLTARGIQNKVLEAVAAGLPCVVTPVVRDGLPGEVLPACASAATADQFAEAIVDRLAWSPGRRREIARTASLHGLTWQHELARLIPLLSAAGTPLAKASGAIGESVN
jgi:sugar transferase (PEP-CTERM/EpsH1 system associated)